MKYLAYADLGGDRAGRDLRIEASNDAAAIRVYEEFKRQTKAEVSYIYGFRLLRLDPGSDRNGSIVVDDMPKFFDEEAHM